MTIDYCYIGKTKADYLKTGIKVYEKRLGHYHKSSTRIIPDLKNAKNLAKSEIKKKEAQLILDRLRPSDYLVVLDEKGKHYTSEKFADWFQQKMNRGTSKIVFQVGGAYGFDESVYQRANEKLALSAMTFSHQMIRLLLVEQVYRAMTILNNEPYHNT